MSSHRRTPTKHSWEAMIARCERPGCHGYARYGGRGITVCTRWRRSFAAFVEDMGERPAGTQLDRIDNSGNYEPGNCRWATPGENSRNRRSTVMILWNGENVRLIELCERLKISHHAIQRRLLRGHTVESAFATPIGIQRNTNIRNAARQ